MEEPLVGSTASSPVAFHATHEPGGANTCAPRVHVRLVRRQPRDLRRDVPGSRLQPVSSRSRSGSIRSAAASHSAPARRSHQISAGCSGSPSAPAATMPSSCEPNDSAAISRPSVADRTSDSVWTSAFVHSAGSCSAQPARG